MTDAEALIKRIHLAATVAFSCPDDSDWDHGYRAFAGQVLKLLAGQSLAQLQFPATREEPS